MLFGSDPTPRIVSIEMGDTGTVKELEPNRSAFPSWFSGFQIHSDFLLS